MSVESASVFLAGSILYSLGYLIILLGIVVANNIIHKYWKSFGWKFIPWYGNPNNADARFMTDAEMEEYQKKTAKSSKK